jgi:RNA polymerase sigma-70 factor (ECF subfamily)
MYITAFELSTLSIEQATMQNSPEHIRELLSDMYRKESRSIFATLIRLLGDFDIAEDALHDAFKSALEQWTDSGVPSNPKAWLVSTGRFKAIDRIRRQSKFNPLQVDMSGRWKRILPTLQERLIKRLEMMSSD